jgi:hypothetical protein
MKIKVFLDVIPPKRTVFDPENGDNMIFRKVGNYLPINTA